MMDQPSRQATSGDISLALVKLFSVLPRRSGMNEGDDDAALAGYELALQGVDYRALGETIGAIIRGEVEGMSTKFCPTPPELSKAVRDQMRRDRLANDVPKLGYQPKPFQSIQMRMDAERERMAREGRKFLCSVASHGAAVEMAKRGKVPPGSVYSGLLGEFYSPIHYQPEGTDDVRLSPSPDAAPGHEPEFGPDPAISEDAGQHAAEIGPRSDDWRRLFDTDGAADEQTANSKTPGTIDSDRGDRRPVGAAE